MTTQPNPNPPAAGDRRQGVTITGVVAVIVLAGVVYPLGEVAVRTLGTLASDQSPEGMVAFRIGAFSVMVALALLLGWAFSVPALLGRLLQLR